MKKSKESILLQNMSIVPVVIFIIFTVMCIVIMVSYHYAHLQHAMGSIKKNYIHTNKILIKNETVKIVNIIKALDTSSKDSEEKTKMKILEVINSIQYDENGYIFIVDKNGDFLINIKESLLWKNQINLQDKKGENIVKKILQTKGEGYISYFGIEGTHTSQSEKISYIKHYVPFGWAIGYGFHPSDIQSRIDQKVMELKEEHQSYLFKFIIVTVGITMGLIILLLLLSKRIERIFRNYKEKIIQKENENRQKNDIIYQQSKMTVIGELLNMISHQWRQPLSQINAITLNMYLEHKEGLLDEKVLKKNIGDIENTTQYLSQTIDDFSHFFIQESKEKVFLVNDSIDHCISILNPSLHHINLQLDFQSKKYLNGYITLFQQTVLSMISNSMNIFNVNNISDPQISISTYDEKNFVFIEISDNGGGISQANISKIFDLYFSTKKQEKQSGLGLYIVKEIIEKNFHGKIKVLNVDKGVKFIIRIECFDIK